MPSNTPSSTSDYGTRNDPTPGGLPDDTTPIAVDKNTGASATTPQWTWDDIDKQLQNFNDIATVTNADGSVSHIFRGGYSNLIRDRFGTPDAPKEGYGYGTIAPPRIPLPTEEEAQQFAYSMGDAFVAMYEDSPETAHWLMNNPRMMFALPEVYAAISNWQENYGAVEGVMDYISADLDVVDYQHWSTANMLNPATAQFLHDYAGYFNQDALDIMATLYAGMKPELQDNLSALAWRWINRGGGEGEGVQDLSNEQVQADFLAFFYEQAASNQLWEQGEETTLGKWGHVVDAPRRAVYGTINNVIGSLWASTVGNPQDALYRKSLTIGQNLAISQGIDPSEGQWKTWSGFYDGLTATVGDPLNALVGLGIAAKASKTVAKAGGATTRLGKLAEAAKAVIPIAGRKATSLPKFSRAPSVRFFHAILGRTSDELLELAWKNNVFHDIHALMGSKGMAGVIERYPQLENLVGGADEILGMAKSPEHVRDIVSELRSGNWLEESGVGFARLTQELSELEKNRVRHLADQISSGAVSIQSFNVGLDGINPAKTGVYAGTLTEGGILQRTELASDGSTKIVFRGKPKVQQVNYTFLRGVNRWANNLRKEAFGTVGLLADEQVKGLEDALKLSRGAIGDQAEPANLELLFKTLSDNTTGFSLGRLTVGDTTSEVFMHMDTAGESAFIFKNADGKVIGGMQGLSEGAGFSWLDPGLRGQRFFNQFVEWAVDNPKIGAGEIADVLRLRGSDPNKTAAGAGAVASQIRTLINKVGSTPEVNLIDSMVGKVLEGRIDLLNADELKMFMRYANAKGIDLIDWGNQGVVVTKHGLSKAVEATDDASVVRTVDNVLAEYDQEVLRTKALLDKVKTSDRSTWIIADLPTRVVPEWKRTLKPWTKFASNDVDTWFGRFRRTKTAQLFGSAAGRSVDLNNVQAGGRDLRNSLNQLGLSRQFINDALNEFWAVPRAERWETVADIYRRAGNEIGHPIIEYALEQFSERGGVFSFGSLPDGSEVAMGASRSVEGKTSALPYMSTQLSNTFELPGPDFMKMVARYNQAKTWQALGRPGRALVKGLTKETGKARQALADGYRLKLKNYGVAEDVLAQFDQEDLIAMAYAKVSGNTNGIGKMQRAMDTAAAPFNLIHNIFTRVQLAGRPITWAMRVALLEEGIRAQFFDLPSFYRNPVRYMGAFYDAALTSRATVHRANQVENIYRFVRTIVPDGQKVTPDLVKGLRKSLPEWSEWVGRNSPESVLSLRGSLAEFLERGMMDMHNLKGFERAGYAASKTMNRTGKKLDRAARVLDRYGLPRDFDWAMIDDIANQGFMSMMQMQFKGGAHRMEYLPGQMTQAGLEAYGTGWGTQVIRHLDDPIFRAYGLGRIESRAAGLADGGLNGAALVHEPAFADMQPTLWRIAEEKGWFADVPEGAAITDVMLADKYLDEIVDPMTSYMFAPILGDDLVDAGRRAAELRIGLGTDLPDGSTFRVVRGAEGHAQSKLRDFVVNTQGNATNFPKSVSGLFDSRMFFDTDANKLSQIWQRTTSKIMEYAGEKTTQTLNRRPGWLAAYRDQYKYLTENLNLPDDLARGIAQTKASEIVNYVFYNLDNGSPFLKRMNRVIPFFGAMWEVSQTWAYKIPMATGNPILGPAMMVRKVDRAFDALRSLGLIEFEDIVGEDGKVQNTSLYLTFDEDPHTGTPLGDLISKAGYKMLGGPRTLVKALAQIRNMLSENDIDYDPEGFWKDEVRFLVGSPLAAAGEQSHGIMAVNQVYLGMDPLKSYLANRVRDMAGVASSSKLADGIAGESLADLANRLDVDVSQLIRNNGVVMRDLFGRDTYAQLVRGTMSPEDIKLDGSEYFEVPGSSFIDEWLDNIIFPFGAEDTVAGSLYDLTPSWAGFFFRGMGLWDSSGDPSNWTELNADGTVHMPDGGSWETGLMEILNNPTSKMQIVGEINKQLLHLEARDGSISRWQAEMRTLEDITQRALEAGMEVLGSGADAELVNQSIDPELAELWQEQRQFVKELNAGILKRAVDNAGGALIFRGVAGAFSPGNPRTLFEEEKWTELYWDARGLAEGDIRGSANWKLPKTIDKFEARQALVKEFIEDPSGDSAKAWFKKTYPEMAVFLNPTTYWTPGGKPPEIDDIDTYFEMVDKGLRAPVPPIIEMQRIGRADLAAEREVAVREEFGHDPWEAASNIVNNWPKYREYLTNSRIDYAAMDYWDEINNDSGYANWKERNAGDSLTLGETITQRFDKITDSIELLEAFAPSQDMDAKERRQYVNALKNAARGFRNFIGDWNEEISGTFLDSPREEALNWYFDSVQAPYYEKLAEMYDKIDSARDSEDVSRIYEDIRQFTTAEVQRAYISPQGGTEFPNAIDFNWNNKTPAEQEERKLRWMAGKPEWLGLDATERLLETAPSLAGYIPSRPEDFEIYREYNLKLQELADRQEPGPDGVAELTGSQATKIKKSYEKTLRQYLLDNGRINELAYQDMWPIERLALAGLLPPQLDKYAGYASGVRQRLQVLDIGPKSQVGQEMLLKVAAELEADMNADPSLWEAFQKLGDVMYDKRMFDSIFPALMYDDRYGEV